MMPNMKKNTLYILNLLLMNPQKGFLTWMLGLGCRSIVIQILAPFMKIVDRPRRGLCGNDSIHQKTHTLFCANCSHEWSEWDCWNLISIIGRNSADFSTTRSKTSARIYSISQLIPREYHG